MTGINCAERLEHPDLDEERIQLWLARLDAHQSADFLPFLSEDEKERQARFKNPDHARQFVIARGILRCLLAAKLNLNPRDLEFAYEPHGKPTLADRNGGALAFNLSHCEDFALYGLTDGRPIGVDLEKVRPLDDLEAVASLTMSSDECEALNALSGDDRLCLFYRLWTCKEATLKRNGNGLHQSMKTIRIDPLDPDPGAKTATTANGQRFALVTFTPQQSLICSASF